MIIMIVIMNDSGDNVMKITMMMMMMMIVMTADSVDRDCAKGTFRVESEAEQNYGAGA